MTDRQEEMLALHALRTLTPEEVRLLESEARYDARMRETLEEFELAAAEIAGLLSAEAPPEELRARLLTKLKSHARGNVAPFAAPFRLLRSPIVAWAAAAAIAAAALGLWTQNRQMDHKMVALVQQESSAKAELAQARGAQGELQKQLADAASKSDGLAAELAHAKERFAVSKMEVAMLRSTLKRYEEGEVLVVWDQQKQEGLIKLEHMPPPQPNKDYQLWVICKQQRAPVNAGVIKVDANGVATVTFKPAKHIAEVAKFAISIEPEGGVPEKTPDGPIVLASR